MNDPHVDCTTCWHDGDEPEHDESTFHFHDLGAAEHMGLNPKAHYPRVATS